VASSSPLFAKALGLLAVAVLVIALYAGIDQLGLLSPATPEPSSSLPAADLGTVLIPAGATVDLLVEMTNPGRWMLHCHIAEHLSSDMMMAFTVE
jgi:FtsP/CotA-like multicopper oxidase with cupredoxin domain